MTIFHDSRDPQYRSPVGAGVCGQEITLRLTAQPGCEVTLRLWIDEAEQKIAMKGDDQGLYEAAIVLPDHPCLAWYYFIVVSPDGETLYYGNAEDGKGGAGGIYDYEPASYQITVSDPAYDTPHWMRNGVMMQIMVDRFCSSGPKTAKSKLRGAGFYRDNWNDPVIIPRDPNTGRDLGAIDFYGGDLKGLTSKLPYLKNMGISVLYLNPIFQAASNHKYDTCDYMKIDPSFGTETDYNRLCRTAEKLGIRIIIDGVFNHTGSDSRYFNKKRTFKELGAYQSRESRYYSWYTFTDWPSKYDCWWGFDEHPNVNEMHPYFLDYIIRDEDSVIAHWMNAGTNGWRLDVADELPMDFLRILRKREKGIDPDSALLGEVWEDPSNKIAYGDLRCYCLGDTLDSTMNYVLRDNLVAFMMGRIDSHAFKRTIDSLMENLPPVFSYSMMNLLGSHDKPRIINVLADCGNMEPLRYERNSNPIPDVAYARGVRRTLAAWNFLCAFPGMPSVYYGDDAGCQGMGDPFCRGTYPWDNINQDVHAAYVEAIERRNANAVLRSGFYRLDCPDPDVVIVERYFENGLDAFGDPACGDTMRLALNRSANPRKITLDGVCLIIPGESAMMVADPLTSRQFI